VFWISFISCHFRSSKICLHSLNNLSGEILEHFCIFFEVCFFHGVTISIDHPNFSRLFPWQISLPMRPASISNAWDLVILVLTLLHSFLIKAFTGSFWRSMLNAKLPLCFGLRLIKSLRSVFHTGNSSWKSSNFLLKNQASVKNDYSPCALLFNHFNVSPN